MATLIIEHVRKVRPDAAGQPVTVLDDVSLSVPAAQMMVIVGPSGGGKSTLVRLLNRLDDPSEGRILLDGEEISGLDPLALRRRVGLVLQRPYMYEGTVLENLQRPFTMRGETPPGAQNEIVSRVLALCRVDSELLSREARTLSIGQQQRVSLARTLIAGPEVLLLDEPTSALDRPTADHLADTLRGICREGALTVVMVTHDLRLASRVADRVAYLEKGRILEEGPAAEVLEHPRHAALRSFLAEPGKGTNDHVE